MYRIFLKSKHFLKLILKLITGVPFLTISLIGNLIVFIFSVVIFYIEKGNANGSSANEEGGGIYNKGIGNNNESSPNIFNCSFVENVANDGGAIYNNGSNSGNGP